jgi:DNA uptake protein ComE-like DNA-binding protein
MRLKILIWLRNFFGFSRSEANGFIILLILMIFALAAPFISKTVFYRFQSQLQTTTDVKELNILLDELKKNSGTEHAKEINEPNFTSFDINKANANQLQASGFPQFLAERIVKYREKVKPFDSKSELLKIYDLDSSFYNKIYPYIRISKIENKEKQLKSGNKEIKKVQKTVFKKDIKINSSKLKPVAINNADTLQLQEIYGIGPAYSKRIIDYRELIGGYKSLNQLNEVYGLKKENLDSLKKYIFIRMKFEPRQLKVNTVDADSLQSHPYISYKEANLIINFRNQHGQYESSNDFYKIKVLDSAWVKKVSSYFSFE